MNMLMDEELNDIVQTGPGCTLWLTGLSGSGKTTISSLLKEIFDRQSIKSICLDGDILRKGINKNLGFSNEDRDENVRRIGEVSKLFSIPGLISITGCISPYAKARREARAIHNEAGLNFIEIFVNSPLEVCEKRDVKGLYKKAREGLIKKFTGIDDIYEKPENAELVLRTDVQTAEECVKEILAFLVSKNILGLKKDAGFSLDDPRCIKELFVRDEALQRAKEVASKSPRWNLTTVDMQWVQVLAEGWASPLTGFMREIDFLQSLHFSGITRGHKFINMSLPIVLAVDEQLKNTESKDIALYYEEELVALLSNVEYYPHRKEERVFRTFGTSHEKHPSIELIMKMGDWLVGGELSVIKQKFTWNDGLDQYRLTPKMIRAKAKELQSDAVFAFQLRNPIHNGHALLMTETKRRLISEMGHKRPILLLHPLGGWVKDDDVPLKERILQHQACIEESVLDKDSTLLAIFPSPMVYAGPKEVQWHARTRRLCGANYYIVGRDPAGIKSPANPDEDLFDPTHGKKVLCNAPGLDKLQILPFTVAAYNTKTGKMEFFDPARKEDFLFISGSKMRHIARTGELPPDGFMAPKAWSIIAEYYSSLRN